MSKFSGSNKKTLGIFKKLVGRRATISKIYSYIEIMLKNRYKLKKSII